MDKNITNYYMQQTTSLELFIIKKYIAKLGA
jgi:hypothetical protein